MSPITFPLNPGDNNESVSNLKAALNLLLQKAQLGLGTEDTSMFPLLLTQEPGYGEVTKRLVTSFQQLQQLPITGVVDEATAAAFNRVLTELGAFNGNIDGFVYMDYGIPAGNVKLRLYSKGFGGSDSLVTESNTNAQGGYAFLYNPANVPNASFEVRAVDAAGKEHALSSTLYSSDKAVSVSDLNLIAPTVVQPIVESEFSRLSKDVSAIVGDIAKLGDAQEKDDQQDITFLSQNTNWDAKTIALAALAAKLSKDTSLTQEAAYALVRAGLPTDAGQLAQLNTDDVKKALKTASDAGAVSLNEQSINAATTQFQTFANSARLNTKDFSSLSSYNDLLSNQQLSDTEKASFANVYFSKRKDGSELWQKAKEAGISEAKIKGLQLQGKLGMLTANNASLIQNLQTVVGDANDLSKLVDQGLYDPEAWDSRLKSVAGNDTAALEKLIPPSYIGESVADRKQAYVVDMATKVREAFPEKVMRHRIETGKITLGDDTVQKGVSNILSKAETLGYKIGKTHIDTFVVKNQTTLFNGATAEQKNSSVNGLKLLTRIHQVTPNDEAMQVLLELGHSSAQDIIAVRKEDFIDRFGKKYSDRYKVGIEEGFRIGKLIYNKSQQVYTTTYSFYTATQTMQQTPPVFAISGPPEKQAADQKSLTEKIKGSPNLEQLFGSLDFCECEHCRSVLSPAAYLVDLLQFVDRKETDWQYFLDKWKADHGGENYEAKFSKPYDALIDRRPDIVNLSLTCENTETALPYIDLVNEILEYYVVNKKLAADAAHDTGDATTPELLAEPQNIEPKAYGILQKSIYPLNLPFDLWLETIREFCNQNEVPLWKVLETIQPVKGADFNTRKKTAIESLNISPSEFALLTDEAPLTKLFSWFGYATATEMNAELKSAKKLSNRLGISYKELFSLMQTEFINPQWKELVLLHKMSVTVNDVFRYKKDANFAAFTADEQKAFEDNLANIKATYGTDAKAALEKAWTDGVYKQILLLNDTNAGCNFDATKVGYADRDALAFDWLKFSIFVRVWQKLGTTISETDATLLAFLPSNLKTIFNDPAKAEPERAKALVQAFSSALINIAHLKELATKVNVGKGAYIKLSALWNDIPSVSKNSLYAQLFLTRSVSKIDPVFDDALGQYLSKDIKIKSPEKDHSIAIQAALNISATDVEQILKDSGQDIGTAKLSKANVSLLYRYALLAKALRLSVTDIIALKQLSGLNPFAPLSAGVLAANEEDSFYNQTLKFADWAMKLKESGVKLEDITFLFRHQFDSTGKYRNVQSNAAATIKLLASEISRIQSAFAVPVNPDKPADLTPFASFTDDALQQNLSLVVPATMLQSFMAMWTGRQPAQWATVKNDLGNFLTEAQFNSLFVPDAAGADDTTKQNNLLQKRSTLAKALLPFIQQKLINQSIVQILASALGSSPARIEWFVSDAGRLHVASDPTAPLRDLFSHSNDNSKGLVNQHAFILLSKIIQLFNVFSLSDKELQYFIDNQKDFGNLDLNTIPVEDNIPIEKVQALFAAFIRLTDYATLQRKLASGGDDLIEVFSKARISYDGGADVAATKAQHLNTLYQQIANLTRRDLSTISTVANALGIEATTQTVDGKLAVSADAFADERGVTALWNALQLIQTFGIPVDALVATREIVSSGLSEEKYQSIADNFKNAVKAKYESDTWQQVAQPVFDKLRQKRRDALVAYLLHTFRDKFSSMEEMYEYFLIDPGTEPVVQTSRIRLATASVQLFIQRCLLNLENRWDKKVSPAAINSKHWQWMNRYRVWEANRKIFLWPENWLEPAWRDDKTHLFKEMEGKLLQGDVSNDLVEDAFYTYLQKMEELARLNVIAMHCEEDPVTPEANTLYVIARTYTFPHKYFYRKYAQEMWTPWEPIDAEIDGDHVVTTIWRGRLHVLWVTFIQKIEGNKTQTKGANSTTKLQDWAVTDALATVTSGANTKTLEAHLHWSEYYQGKWTMKQSGGFDNPVSKTVASYIMPNHIVISISKEPNISDEVDGPIRINLSDLGGFRLVNKNSPPEIIAESNLTNWKFTAGSHHINRVVVDDDKLSVSYQHLIKTLNNDTQEVQSNPQVILGKTFGNFNLVPCSSPVTMGGEEFGPLVTPFFYQDSWHTFYVQPELTETVTIKDWDEWVGGYPMTYDAPKIDFDNIKIKPYYPWPKNVPIPKRSGDPGFIDPGDSRIKIRPELREDWTTSPNTYIKFGDRVIGKDATMNVLVTMGDSKSPVVVRDGGLLNTIIHGATDTHNVVLVPVDKGTTLNEGNGNLLKDSINVKDTLLVGGAGITTSRPVIIGRLPGGTIVRERGAVAKETFVNRNRGL